MTVTASIAKTGSLQVAAPPCRIAIIIPAHDEGDHIIPTITSLQNSTHPASHFDIWVIADNCTDDTAAIARSVSGSVGVLERTDHQQRGKGFALRYAIDHLLQHENAYQGFMIIDADTEVDANTLQVADSYLAEGHQVIQLNDMVAGANGSWSNESIRIGFILYNFVRPLGRKYLGLPAGLRGNGMVFSRDLLTQYRWQCFSKAEDLEFGLFLLLAGEHVIFAPEGVVWAKMTQSAGHAESQRARWEAGRWPLLREYVPALLKQFFKTPKWRYMDALIDLTMPPLVNLIALLGLLWILTLIGYFIGLSSFVPVVIASAGVLGGFIHLFAGLRIYPYGTISPNYLIKGLPRYVWWKLLLYLKMLFKGVESKWIRTVRE